MKKVKLIIGSVITLFLIISSIFIFTDHRNYTDHRSSKNEFSIREVCKPKTSNSYNISIVTPEAKDYDEAMSGYYPGSHSFDNDLVNTAPYNWIDNSTGTCTALVVDEWDDHKKVLKLTDNDVG
ncbi:MAG: hypothetical protein JSW60_09710, partial [Thermoplasmatales archaeon]